MAVLMLIKFSYYYIGYHKKSTHQETTVRTGRLKEPNIARVLL